MTTRRAKALRKHLHIGEGTKPRDGTKLYAPAHKLGLKAAS